MFLVTSEFYELSKNKFYEVEILWKVNKQTNKVIGNAHTLLRLIKKLVSEFVTIYYFPC